MSRLRSVLYILIILALIAAVAHLNCVLPLDTNSLIEEKYSGWSGVLRIWVYEGWQPGIGSSSSWLTLCGNSFEKNHEGVYIQIQYVQESALINLCENGILPPDIILFPPGTIEYPRYLASLCNADSLKHGLKNSGSYQGMIYAQPILMGGYIWAYNTALLEFIPDSWENISLSVGIPADERHHKWSAALMCLCSSPYFNNISEDNSSYLVNPSLDIGLPSTDDHIIPDPTQMPPSSTPSYCRLSDNFLFSDSAYSQFLNGNIAAVPVTQREIYRLEQRSSQGNGPEWQISITGDITFSDQILYAAVIDNYSNLEKQELCKEFISFLLTEDCQNQLYRIGAFSTTCFESGYPGYDSLVSLEYILFNHDIYAAPAFKTGHDERINNIVEKFIDNKCFSEKISVELSQLIQ